MKTLRFLCFASLIGLLICLAGGGHIGFANEADLVGMPTPCQEETSKVLCSSNSSSGVITIIMTGIVDEPGDDAERGGAERASSEPAEREWLRSRRR